MKLCTVFIGGKIQHHKDFNWLKFTFKLKKINSIFHGIWEIDSKINMEEYKFKRAELILKRKKEEEEDTFAILVMKTCIYRM